MEEEKKEEVKEVGETPPTEAQPEEEEKKEEVPAAGNPVISHPEVMLKLICDDGEIPEVLLIHSHNSYIIILIDLE